MQLSKGTSGEAKVLLPGWSILICQKRVGLLKLPMCFLGISLPQGLRRRYFLIQRGQQSFNLFKTLFD